MATELWKVAARIEMRCVKYTLHFEDLEPKKKKVKFLIIIFYIDYMLKGFYVKYPELSTKIPRQYILKYLKYIHD